MAAVRGGGDSRGAVPRHIRDSGTLGARAGLIIHRLRASRPPSVPIIQRYYIDILFLIIAGALYWELQARGELVSGGLFGQQDVNEALLIAPALFLLTLGMLFFRIFPMFIRYISGESLALVHLAAGAALAALVPAVLITDIRAGYTTGLDPVHSGARRIRGGVLVRGQVVRARGRGGVDGGAGRPCPSRSYICGSTTRTRPPSCSRRRPFWWRSRPRRGCST